MPISRKIRFLVGVDEVGRGPIAGPVTVCVFCVSSDFVLRLKNYFPKRKVRDSKKLSASAREGIYKLLKNDKSSKRISFAVSSVSANVIDQSGITYAIKRALANSFRALKLKPVECTVLLDGGLRAPVQYENQRTIVKGDEKEPVIALASIVAKVTRDTLMRGFALKYPQYDFGIHKGYGTRNHYRKIKKHGFSDIHRRSFLSRMSGA